MSFRSSLLLAFILPFGAVLTTVVLALPLALASDWVAVDGCRFDAVWGSQKADFDDFIRTIIRW